MEATTHTMTTNGYINLVFTETNPTSTTTTIKVVHNQQDGDDEYTLGPYTVIPHETPVTTLTPTQPPSTIKKRDSSMTRTSKTTVTVSSISSLDTTVTPNCEFLVTEFLAVVYWHLSQYACSLDAHVWHYLSVCVAD